MKKLFFCLISISIYGQIPKNYYSSAKGKGYELKTQLHQIINQHKDLGYNGLWQTYKTSDIDNFYDKDGSLLDIYSENPKGKDAYNFILGSNQCGIYSNEGDCYNREHIIPQSTFHSASPMVADAHFIPPTDGKVNGKRSNYPHGYVSKIKWTSKNGSKLGTCTVEGYKGTAFEPIDEFKGDIARMYFYFVTCYENKVASFNYEMFNGSKDQVFTDGFKNMLLEWHQLDPVSKSEVARNNAIFKRQENRNPFIDHPEWVEKIWGKASKRKENKNTDSDTKVVTTEIEQTKAKNNNSHKIISKDVYFSAYIEGTGNNKALVITNGSGKTIDLSNYRIKKQTNGKGDWSKGLKIKTQLAPKQSLTLMYKQTNLKCSNSNILKFEASELAFNGNDPIGLFLEDQLVDCLGNFDDTSTFSENETLVRIKQSGKTIFNKKDWKVLAIDTCQ